MGVVLCVHDLCGLCHDVHALVLHDFSACLCLFYVCGAVCMFCECGTSFLFPRHVCCLCLWVCCVVFLKIVVYLRAVDNSFAAFVCVFLFSFCNRA